MTRKANIYRMKNRYSSLFSSISSLLLTEMTTFLGQDFGMMHGARETLKNWVLLHNMEE
jgi:hypothetical protein